MKEMWDKAQPFLRIWILTHMMDRGLLHPNILIIGGEEDNRDYSEIKSDLRAYLRRHPWKVIRAAFVK